MEQPHSAELHSWMDLAEPAMLHNVGALGTADFLRSALEGAKVGTWQLDMLTGLVTWDKVTSQIFGMEAVPMTTGALLPVHEDDRERMAQSLERSFNEGGAHDAEFRGVRTDGEIRWLRGLARPAAADGGATRYLVGIVYDITDQKRAEEARAESERQLRAIIDALPGVTYRCELEPPWRLSFVSEAVQSLTGYGQDDFTSGRMTWLDVIYPDDTSFLISNVAKAVSSNSPYSLRYRIRQRSGAIRWVEARGKAAYDGDGAPLWLEGFVGDIHEQVVADQRIREAEERFRLASKATMDLIWDWDLLTDQLTWNEALDTCFGYSQAELGSTGEWWMSRIHPDDRDRVVRDVEKFLHSGAVTYIGEYRFQRADGSYAEIFDRGYVIRDSAGQPTRMVGAMQDLTERKEAERRLLWAATRDPLTDLPNRSLFRDSLKEALSSARAQAASLAVVLLDLDNFKQVNDTLGHDAGDALLKTFASRLTACVPHGDVVARLGGDEFALIFKGVADELQLRHRAQAVIEALRRPFVHDGRILDCRASLGAAIFPLHGTKPQELLKHADIALYVAKGSARGDLAVFEPRHRADLQKRISTVSVAKRAIKTGSIVPYYQPKVRLDDRSVYGFEALLRWKNGPKDSVRLPGSIAAAFDDPDVACAISDCIIHQVIEDIRNWLDRGVPFGHVAVNASAAEFHRDDFAQRLLARLRAANVPPSSLQLEVTETVFLGRGAECVERALKHLSSNGIKIALDDFGTGYASLRHLKQFPVDVIKIDKSFVAGMQPGGGDTAIIEAVLNLGRSLEIDVIAEGIEDRNQEALLVDLGCKYGQGFLYSQAAPSASVEGLLRKEAFPRRLPGLAA